MAVVGLGGSHIYFITNGVGGLLRDNDCVLVGVFFRKRERKRQNDRQTERQTGLEI